MIPSIEYSLFDHYDLARHKLRNRIVMAPMTRCRAVNNIPTELMATYYSQRAGAGLIITEGTAPSPDGLGYARTPGLYTSAQIEGWKKVTKKVHQMGGKIFVQLMHCGRIAHPENMPDGGKVLAPSAIAATDTKMYVDGKGNLDLPVPKAMTSGDIGRTVEAYKQAAKNAIQAGFDGVELHGANGYLLNQFINPQSNQRDDEYGGAIEGRSRFVLEVAKEVVAAIGSQNVGIRLSPYGAMNDLKAFDDIDEDYLYLVTQLNRLGLTYLHLVDHSAMGSPTVPESIKDKLRTVWNNTLILSGGYDKERAEMDIQTKKADLIAFGRPFIANPDLVGRFVENAKLTVPDDETFYTPGAEGYIDYSYLAKA